MRDGAAPGRGRFGRGKTRRPAGPPVGRRNPPPEATGHEGRYLNGLRERARPVTCELIDGTRLRGVIARFDRQTLQLATDEGFERLLARAEIRWIEE